MACQPPRAPAQYVNLPGIRAARQASAAREVWDHGDRQGERCDSARELSVEGSIVELGWGQHAVDGEQDDADHQHGQRDCDCDVAKHYWPPSGPSIQWPDCAASMNGLCRE